MALIPLYQWKLEKDGSLKRDVKGNKIPHPQIGQRKAGKDWSAEEKKTYEMQIEFDVSSRRRSAQQTLEPLADANKLLGNN